MKRFKNFLLIENDKKRPVEMKLEKAIEFINENCKQWLREAYYQIIRKVFPEAFAEGIEGVGLHPIRVNIA
jgi:hypothetical protein